MSLSRTAQAEGREIEGETVGYLKGRFLLLQRGHDADHQAELQAKDAKIADLEKRNKELDRLLQSRRETVIVDSEFDPREPWRRR